MKKLHKSLTALIFCLILTLALSSSAFAADVGRVTGLKASSVKNNSITLTWNPISAADGYRVQYRSGNGESYSAWTDLTDSLQATSYTVKNLKLGVTYIFRVNAYDEVTVPFFGGVSKDHANFSTEISVTNNLGKVTGLKVVTTTPTKVKLSWTKLDGADGYLVQKYVSGTGWKNVKSTTATTYTVTGLKTNTTTSFRVRAYVTQSGKKVYGSVSSTVKGKTGVPKISDFKVTSSSTTSVKLSWDTASVTGYQIYRKTETSSWKKYKTIYSKSTSSYTNTGLKLGTKYSYRIRGFYKTDSKTYYGDFTSAKSVRPSLPAVVGIELNSITKTKAAITWDKVSGAQGYQVYDYSSGKAVKLPTVKTNKAYIDIEDGRVYKIKVRAYTKATESGATSKGTFSDAYEIYSTPGRTNNFVGEVMSDGSVQFTWESVEHAHGYKIEVINISTNRWETFATCTDNIYTVDKSSSLPGANFRVSAYVRNSGVALYGQTSETIFVKAIQRPELYVEDTNQTAITLAWSAVGEADRYVLEKYDFDNDTWTILKETTETRYTDRGSDPMGGLYRVYAKNSDSKSSSSEEVTANTSGITVTQDGAAQTITWNPVDGAAKYRVLAKQRGSDRGLLNRNLANVTDTSADISLTPGAIESISVYAYAANGDFAGCAVENLIIKTADFKILSPGHTHYDHSVNSQLLYLVEAINKSKHETDTVTVTSSSVVAYDTEKLYVNSTAFNGNNIEGLLNFINALTDLDKDEDDLKNISLSGKETSNETLTFTDCIAKNEQDKSINLARYIDPSDEEYAYLYGSDDPTAWKDGVKSVSVAPLSGGGYKFVVELYEESYGSDTNVSEAFYHTGFATTVASLGQFANSNLENQLTTVGDTTITAVVNADGTLDSYQVSSPYSMKMKSPVTGIIGINSFGMQISGTVSSNYKFTR